MTVYNISEHFLLSFDGFDKNLFGIALSLAAPFAARRRVQDFTNIVKQSPTESNKVQQRQLKSITAQMS